MTAEWTRNCRCGRGGGPKRRVVRWWLQFVERRGVGVRQVRMLGAREARTHHEELQHVLDRDGKLEGDDDEVTTQSTTVPDPLREMTAWHDVPALAIT